ncbi:MAG: ABC transporter permease [Ignavibacteriaceae bacterium]
MGFEPFIAKRYLVSKHKINFITIISLISIAGITIGVAALIVVLSVFNGFGSLVTSFLINFDPDVRVEVISENVPPQEEIIRNLQIDDVKKISPFVSGKVLAYRDQLTEVVNLKGISEPDGEEVYGIQSNTVFGKYELSEQNGYPKIMMGLRLADHLQTLVGDTITLVSPAGIERVISQFSEPQMQQFIVSGIYSSNNNDYDANYIFTSLESAQVLLGYNGNVQGYDIRLTSIDNAEGVKEILEQNLEKDKFQVSTWYDFHKELYSYMQVERWAAYIILSLIIAVATFNILGSLSMSVIEKKRDIGILRSMGVVEKSILKIFMFEGLLIGIAGTFLGVMLGYLVCFIHLQYNIYPLDPTQYKIAALPLELRVSDFFYITGVSILLSFLASLFPAKRAAKINPLEAIKWE